VRGLRRMYGKGEVMVYRHPCAHKTSSRHLYSGLTVVCIPGQNSHRSHEKTLSVAEVLMNPRRYNINVSFVHFI
jgi:hypothetical protein